ncbi:hypothetical protein JCM10213_004567 [Rhodosporidiobolus nylandii]
MHSHLHTHVLALAPDSLASLGELDQDSLSELWAVFTRCKDSLQNGRRLENLTWRLLARREQQDKAAPLGGAAGELDDARADEIRAQVQQEGWSDPEWEETSDSGSDSDVDERVGRPSPALSPVASPRTSAVLAPSPPPRPRARTASVPADPSGATKEPPQRPEFRRGGSREWKSAPVISGGSLQRMIADLQRLPEIPVPGKARSLHEVGAAPPMRPSASRGSSAPDSLSTSSLSRSSTASGEAAVAKVDALTQTTPSRSRRASLTRSPCMSRSASSPAHPTTAASGITVTAPTPSPCLAPPSRRVPSALTMSALPSARRSRPSSPARMPSPPSPVAALRLTPTETVMMALSNSRNQSDANLHRRTQSTAELAASFKPASFVKGFSPSPSSLEAHPRPGSIAPPPTPATQPSALAPSPPPAKTPASSPASLVPALRATTPAKVPPPRMVAGGPTPAAAHARPAAMKPPGREKKIFFISSPESDEDHSSRSRESNNMRVIVTPPTASKPSPAKQPSSGEKGKASAQLLQEDDEDEWDSEDEDDDASSGWGSEYSTDSEVAGKTTSSGTRASSAAATRPELDFTKRAPSELLTRTASTASMGQPGELKPRPPGLLSQIFHPEQFLEEEAERPRSAAEVLRRNHKSMSALPALGQLRPSKSAAMLNDRRLMQQRRSKSFLKGKPEDVELESSSEEEEEGEDERAALAQPVSRDERSSDYEDVEDASSSSAESAAALLARRQRLAAELEAQSAALAPPQTPRTTRRAMLATELSESLRRNLLWERQTRNRVMGGAVARRPPVPGQPLPQRPASSAQLAPPSAQPAPPPHVHHLATDGVRAPHPSPATRHSPPIASQQPPPRRSASFANLPRRHTTGTGLYLAAQQGWAKPVETDSELSDTEDEDDNATDSPAEVFGGRVW